MKVIALYKKTKHCGGELTKNQEEQNRANVMEVKYVMNCKDFAGLCLKLQNQKQLLAPIEALYVTMCCYWFAKS